MMPPRRRGKHLRVDVLREQQDAPTPSLERPLLQHLPAARERSGRSVTGESRAQSGGLAFRGARTEPLEEVI